MSRPSDSSVEPGTRSPLRAGATGAATTVVAVLPKSLVAAMVVQISDELDFGTRGLGVAVAIYWTSNALSSVPLGRLADRLGAIRSLRAAALVAAGSALGIALFAQRWWHLVVFLAISGAGHSMAHPGANRMLVSQVRPGRLGLGFGFKQAAAPAATTLAGLSVPVLAVTVGWRWAFVGCAALAVPVLMAIGSRPPPSGRTAGRQDHRGPLKDRRTVLLLAAAFGLAAAANMAVQIFFVDAVVAAGASPSAAGTVLAVASIAAIAVRLSTGALSDRMRGGHLKLCAALQAVGVAGILLMSIGRPTPMMAGAIIALTGTWGFNAIFWYALVSRYREAPGRITGAVQPGAAVGGIVVPVIFGFVAEASGYQLAWLLSAGLATVAAGTTWWASRLFAPVARQDGPASSEAR